MHYLLFMCQLLLATIFLLAGIGKLIFLEHFAATLRLSHFPDALVDLLKIFVPALELCLAAAILLAPAHLLSAVMSITTGVLIVFTMWMVWIVARGLHLSCSCFGTSGSHVNRRTIARNVLMIAVAVSGTLLSTRTSTPLLPSSIWTVITVVSTGFSVALLYALKHALPALALTMGKFLRPQTHTE